MRKATGPTQLLAPDTSAKLFHRYFECIHPMWPILYKPLFNTIDFGNPSPKIASALIFAIYAIAASIEETATTEHDLFSTEPHGGRENPNHHWLYAQCLGLLNLQSDKDNVYYGWSILEPSITNCQVLAILALQQHGIAEYAQSAALNGQAIAMALDLRLNRAYASGHPAENEIRNRLWWSLYTLDKTLSLKLARPISLYLNDSDAPYPSISESDEFELMPTHPTQHSVNADRMPTKMHTISGFHMTIGLASIGEKIAQQIYSIASRKRLRQDHVTAEDLRLKIWNDLEAWEQEMGNSALKLDLEATDDPVPSAITAYLVRSSNPVACIFCSH